MCLLISKTSITSWRIDDNVLLRKITGHQSVDKIRDSLALDHEYGACMVPSHLFNDKVTEKTEAEDQ